MALGKRTSTAKIGSRAVIKRTGRGFTLIELLVVLAILAILASAITLQYVDRVDTARETVLRQNLSGLRTAIDHYYRDKQRYPASLADLVQDRYVRAVPKDPITDRVDSWIVLPPQGDASKGVFDVKSGAAGLAQDGTAFSSW